MVTVKFSADVFFGASKSRTWGRIMEGAGFDKMQEPFLKAVDDCVGSDEQMELLVFGVWK